MNLSDKRQKTQATEGKTVSTSKCAFFVIYKTISRRMLIKDVSCSSPSVSLSALENKGTDNTFHLCHGIFGRLLMMLLLFYCNDCWKSGTGTGHLVQDIWYLARSLYDTVRLVQDVWYNRMSGTGHLVLRLVQKEKGNFLYKLGIIYYCLYMYTSSCSLLLDAVGPRSVGPTHRTWDCHLPSLFE